MSSRPVLALLAGVLGLACLLFACNAVLGITEAMLEPNDAGGGGTLPEGAPAADAGSLYALNCSNYCSVITAACGVSAQGNNTEYLGDGGICLQMCQQLEVSGEVLDPATDPTPANTLNCRVWHSNAARLGDPHVHCPHAGPLGGKLCEDMGDPCIPFCQMDLAFCTGQNAVYASNDACLAACRPDAGYAGYPYQVSVIDPEVTDLAPQFQGNSNTLNCRIYHLQNFLNTGLAIHCQHTSPSGSGVCTSLDGG